MLLSEPIIEAAAYQDRALQNLERRLPAEEDAMLAMFAFRALAGVRAGSAVLVVGPAPPLLRRALATAGYAVNTLEGPNCDSLADAAFDAILLLDGRDATDIRRVARTGAVLFTVAGGDTVSGWRDVERIPVPGGELTVALAD